MTFLAALKARLALGCAGGGGPDGRRGRSRYCLDGAAVERARREGRPVGEPCVEPAGLYFDNVRYVDARGEFHDEGELGVLGWDGVGALLSSGSLVRSAEAEGFMTPDLECPWPASGALVVYHDDNYGLPKVSYRPREGFFREDRKADMVRLAEAFWLRVFCGIAQLLYVASNAHEHLLQLLPGYIWDVAGRHEEAGRLLGRICSYRRGAACARARRPPTAEHRLGFRSPLIPRRPSTLPARAPGHTPPKVKDAGLSRSASNYSGF